MSKALSLLILCVFASFAHAGDADKEITAAFSELSAEERADSLNSAGYQLTMADRERARQYIEAATELAESLKYDNGRIRAHQNMARLHYGSREYIPAVEQLQQAFEILDGDETHDDSAVLYYRYAHALNGGGRTMAARRAFHNSLRIHTAKNDSLGVAMLTRALGLLFIRTAEYDSSLVYYGRAKGYYEELGNTQRVAAMINSMGASYYQLGLYEKALEHYQQSLLIRREVKDLEGVSRVLTNIGMLYTRRGDYDDAEPYFIEAGQKAKEAGHVGLVAYSLTNLGELLETRGDLDGALEYYLQALEYNREYAERSNLVLSLNAVGARYAKMGRLKQAMLYLGEAHAVADTIMHKEGMAAALMNMGVAYVTVGDNKRASDAFEKSMNITKSTGNRELLRETLGHIAGMKETSGDYKGALTSFKRYEALKDSIYGEAATKNIDRLKVEYESDQKERENEMFRQRHRANETLLIRNKTIIILISVSLAMGAVFIAILSTMYRGKKRANVRLNETNREVTLQRDEIEHKNTALEDALREIKTLSGMLPICSSCKKIRDDSGYWDEVEGYISKHSEAIFSHSICPDCMVKLYPDYADKKDGQKDEGLV